MPTLSVTPGMLHIALCIERIKKEPSWCYWMSVDSAVEVGLSNLAVTFILKEEQSPEVFSKPLALAIIHNE